MEDNQEKLEDFRYESKKINRLIKEGKYEKARIKGNKIINRGGLTEEEGAILYSQMSTIELRTGFFKKAIDYINEAFEIYPNMEESQKCLMKRQLISIETQKKDYKKARNLINDSLNNLPENEQLAQIEKIKLKSQLLYIAVQELNREEAMNISEELLNNLSGNEDIDNRTKDIVKDKLRVLDEMEKKENIENKPKNKPVAKFYDRFDNGNLLTLEDIKIIEQSHIAKYYYKGENSKYSRSNLYLGKIKFNELQELAEENRNTLAGCIFIAETCKYFGMERMGKQCIQGFKMDKHNLNDDEKKILDMAMDILNEISIANGFGRSRWNQVYESIEKYYEQNEKDL